MLAAKGSPSTAPNNLKVCRRCYDPAHPQSFLPIAAAAHGADPQQLREPRPDVFPVAYPLSLIPSSLARGSAGTVIATAVFKDPPTFSTDDPNIAITSTLVLGAMKVSLGISVAADAAVGQHVITLQDANGTRLNGLLAIL